MNGSWKGPFASRAVLKSIALVAGTWLVLGGSPPSQAQQPKPCSTQVTLGWTINNPSLDDQRAIMDLLSLYAWTIDDRDADAFVALFMPDKSSYYELCNGGGLNQIFKLTFDNSDLANDLKTQMRLITKALKDGLLQTRHLVTNTLLDTDGKTINTKSTVLVTIQDGNLGLEAPDLDYSADVRASFAKDNSGHWKFQTLTVYADIDSSAIKKR